MHDHDGEIVFPLKLSEERQELGNFSCMVLISSMKPHQRIEHEQARLKLAEGFVEPQPVAFEIESEARGRDDMDRNALEIDPAVPTESLEALAHECGMILGEIDEHIAGVGDFEPIEAGCGGGDGEREIEPEPGLPELGAPTYETDSRPAPELLDEPEGFFLRLLELPHAADR
jgi:hypothetical protein